MGTQWLLPSAERDHAQLDGAYTKQAGQDDLNHATPSIWHNTSSVRQPGRTRVQAGKVRMSSWVLMFCNPLGGELFVFLFSLSKV
jgi:hypothetical protein